MSSSHPPPVDHGDLDAAVDFGPSKPPALPGEVWRVDDDSCAVTMRGETPVPWMWSKAGAVWVEPGRALGWVILGMWGMAERARAEKAERALDDLAKGRATVQHLDGCAPDAPCVACKAQRNLRMWVERAEKAGAFADACGLHAERLIAEAVEKVKGEEMAPLVARAARAEALLRPVQEAARALAAREGYSAGALTPLTRTLLAAAFATIATGPAHG